MTNTTNTPAIALLSAEESARKNWNLVADEYNQWEALGKDEKDALIAQARLAAQPVGSIHPQSCTPDIFLDAVGRLAMHDEAGARAIASKYRTALAAPVAAHEDEPARWEYRVVASDGEVSGWRETSKERAEKFIGSPVAKHDGDGSTYEVRKLYTRPAPVAAPTEPAAWIADGQLFTSHDCIPPRLLPPIGVPEPLYRIAAPVAAQADITEPAEEVVAYTYASTQATKCAECGQHKHTPLRIDAMGGYVCLTCIDQRLGSLLGEFGYAEADSTPATSAGEVDTTASVSGECERQGFHSYEVYSTDGKQRCTICGDEYMGRPSPIRSAAPAAAVRAAERVEAMHKGVAGVFAAIKGEHAATNRHPVSPAVEQPADDAEDAQTQAARDVLAERRRQVEAEGRTPEHDDMYIDGQMAVAAGYYALACGYPGERDIARGHVPQYWPWAPSWWKPRSVRRNLIKAGALILAEIERLDRAAATNHDDRHG